MAEFRTFNDEYIPSILSFLETHLQNPFLSETVLREKTVDDPDFNPDLVLSLWEGSELIAVLSAVCRGQIGCIKFLCVHQAYRRKGFGRQLLQQAEKNMQSLSTTSVEVGYAPPNYLVPGIEDANTAALQLFQTQGYAPCGRADLVRISAGQFQQFKSDMLPKAISVERAGYENMTTILDYCSRRFPHLLPAVSAAYNSLPVTLFQVLQAGVITGLAAHNTNNFGCGWLGPIALEDGLPESVLTSHLLGCCLEDIAGWEQDFGFWPRFDQQQELKFNYLPESEQRFVRLKKELQP